MTASSLTRSLVLALLAVLSFGGCSPKTDLGAPCRMTRAGANPGAPPVAISEASVQNPALDYVAFGAAECDNLVCLRTAESRNPENRDGAAIGYCSAPCASDSDCTPDFDDNEGSLVCAIVLPEMEALQRDDPVLYEETFSSGTGASNRYCIRPRVPAP